jgi:hypothetical protein
MKYRLCCVAAIALSTAATSVKAGVIFSDDFEEQNVGDNGTQLLHWAGGFRD